MRSASHFLALFGGYWKQKCGPQAALHLVFPAGDPAPLLFLDHRVKGEEIGVGFTDAVCLAGKDTGQAQQTAFNRQHADSRRQLA